MPCIKPESSSTFMASLVFLLLSAVAVVQVNCLNFNYTSFNDSPFKFNGNSSIFDNNLQVTRDASDSNVIQNLSGRIINRQPFGLWSKKRKEFGSFHTAFVLRITPKSSHVGEGLAFTLTKDLDYIPPNSSGQWLGIVSEITNGSSSNPIVAVEFDTKQSYSGDLDDNHVGVDINSVYSVNQTSLTGHGINISDNEDHTAVIRYNGTSNLLQVFVFNGSDVSRSPNSSDLVISMPLNLSDHLPEVVYVGFSASTGTSVELNCIRSWSFSGPDVDHPSTPLWLWVMLGSLVGAVVITVVLMAGYKLYRRIYKPIEDQDDESYLDEIEISAIGPKKYLLKELKSATGNFSPQNELGRGGFGVVYKGILKGEEVAVKRSLLKNNRRGMKSMIAEVITIGELRQKNVVKLTGWCYDKNELLLVYEYMPNGSLDKLLFPEPEGEQQQAVLTWERRYNIVCGVAQSLDYLHNGCSQIVLHRDIKTSNMMLDADFNPCLGDFGLARMYKASERTHHTTLEIAGTPPYMAPEILFTSQATTHTDVYAFGVLLLEVVCGRKPGIEATDGKIRIIVDRVWELHESGMICAAIDPKLDGNFDKEQAERVLLIGLACCHPNPYTRPSMRSGLQALKGEALPPVVPLEKPAFVWPAVMPSFAQELDGSFSGGMLSSPGSFSGR